MVTNNDIDKIVKVLSKSKKGSIISKTFKPRHGVRLQCPYCAWRFRGGGYASRKEAAKVEEAQKKIHRQLHLKHRLKSVRELADPDKSLHIQRDSHSAEIPHFFDETATRQVTTSTTYVDVPGASITNGLAANQDNLVIVTAQMDNSTTGNVGSLQMMRGTTAIADSEMAMESNVVGDRHAYNWWGVINTGATETIKMQYKISTGTVGVDLISIIVVKLTPDLTPDVDYKYSLNSTATSFSALDTDLASNNAQASITPAVANHKWLIMGKSRVGTGITSLVAPISKLVHSGGGTNSFPQARWEGEDGTLDNYILMTMRVDTLTAVNHIYTEISQLNTSGTGAVVAGSRTHSGVFMLDLDKFKNVATPHQEDDTQELPNNSTAYAETVGTTTIVTQQTGDVLFLGYTTMDAGGSGFTYKMRMQINQTDPQDLPTPSADDVTTKSYDLLCYDTADRAPLLYATVENLTAATHTIDIDGSANTTTGSEGTLDRSIIAFTMELAASGGVARLMVCNETATFTETKMTSVKGVLRTFVKGETMTLSETNAMQSSGGSNLIQPANWVMRLSGGASNVTTSASRGGAMSTVAGAVITDVMALWDIVGQTESSTGESEYRCIYITNTHPTLTMQDIKIWFDQNTPAGDEVWMGVGSAAVNAQEQGPTAAEETAPTAVTFVLASAVSPLALGNLPAGQKRSLWFKRVVPPATAAHAGNTYSFRGRFQSDPA